MFAQPQVNVVWVAAKGESVQTAAVYEPAPNGVQYGTVSAGAEVPQILEKLMSPPSGGGSALPIQVVQTSPDVQL